MVSEYQENRFFNDEKDGDSPELTRAKKAFNKALRREYSRRNGYDEDGDYIGTDNNQRVPGSSFLSGLRLGNRQEETPSQGVRLALNDYTNSMSDTPIRLAQNDPNKKDPFLDIKEANDFVYRHARSQLYNCIDLLNNYLIYDPDIFRSSYIEGSARCDTAQQQKRYDGRYPEVASDEAFTRCINSGREEEYCNEFKKSMLQCFKDAVEDAEQNGIAYTACGFGAPSKEGIFYKIFKALK